MQFLKIDKNTSLSCLISRLGNRNTENILALNNLKRQPDIGAALENKVYQSSVNPNNVSVTRKQSILNTMTSDTDIFEKVALLNSSEWRILSDLGTFKNYLRVPDDINISDGFDVLGDGIPVKKHIYNSVMQCVLNNKDIDANIFNEYSVNQESRIIGASSVSNPIQWFKLPWGKVTLYSSMTGESVEFPVFPEDLDDGVKANYDTMPDMLYQYEPWVVYQSSGARVNTYTFKMHRDMWTGDHRDDKCNELIRFCESNCYPEYRGASVQTALVTLYIGGEPHITGIMTDVKQSWSGPLGLDDWYLFLELQLTIQEVAKTSLNYTTIRKRSIKE